MKYYRRNLMYAQVRKTQFHPEKCVAALGIMRDFIVPVLKRQAGNMGVTLLVDHSSGMVSLISLWETETAMLAPFDPSHYMREQRVLIVGHAVTQPTWE